MKIEDLTMDHIQTLRLKGQTQEASRLLRTWHEYKERKTLKLKRKIKLTDAKYYSRIYYSEHREEMNAQALKKYYESKSKVLNKKEL